MKTRWKTKGYHEQHWQRKDNVCGCGMKLLRDTFYNQFRLERFTHAPKDDTHEASPMQVKNPGVSVSLFS